MEDVQPGGLLQPPDLVTLCRMCKSSLTQPPALTSHALPIHQASSTAAADQKNALAWADDMISSQCGKQGNHVTVVNGVTTSTMIASDPGARTADHLDLRLLLLML